MGYKIAVAGATGAVGQQIFEALEEVGFPVDEIVALASERSVGKEVSFGEKTLKVKDLATFDFEGWDIALFSPGGKVSAVHAPRAAEAGCVVIDNTSHFRMEPDVPLIVPEVNPEALAGYTNRNIIANPNCSTIQMVVALKPLHDVARIKRVVCATYQAAAGAGTAGMDELYYQTKGIYQLEDVEPNVFQKQIAFNCIPQIGSFMDDGSTHEEWKMVHETKKILDPEIEVSVTCVRVPVLVGHSEAVNIEFEEPIDLDQAYEALSDAPGVVLLDRREDGGYATPVESVGDSGVFVSRVREDTTVPYGLTLWVVSDNLRKGAAYNAVQIAQELAQEYM
ncbi:MAG TPA: aspartate-semialdehyde dehydrogenase [Opitutales bacterium]|nr:aspartate-semialdehyde dehydrogenase [Opitutales bacterium]